MEKFKRAVCIELHNSNMAITTKEASYVDTCLVGRTEFSDKPAYRINLNDLNMIARSLGFVTEKSVEVSKLSDQSTAIPGEVQNTEYVDIPIFKAHYDYTNSETDVEIIKIECNVISEKLVDIFITFKYRNEEEVIEQLISYSGSFTIWWDRQTT